MSIYTYRGIYDQVLRMLDEVGDTGTTLALAKDLVNQAHQRRCGQHPWSFLISDVKTFTTEVGRTTYSLHQEFDRPLYFKNVTQNDLMIEKSNANVAPEGWLEPLAAAAASARHFVLWGTSPVREQPSAASALILVSSSSLDTGSNYQVAIKGEDSSGDVFAEVVTLTGTTPVSTSASFARILAVTKSQEFNGTLTLTASSTTLLTLLGWEMGRQYPQITLLETPSAAEQIEYRFYRKPLILVNDYDVPEIPAPHSQILVWDALILFAGYNQDAEPFAAQLWREQQAALEKDLYQHYLERQTLEAGTRYVRWVGDL